MTLPNGLGNFVEIEGTLGNENHVGAARDAAVNSDPARIAPHYFDHDHAIVSFSRGVNAIDGLG